MFLHYFTYVWTVLYDWAVLQNVVLSHMLIVKFRRAWIVNEFSSQYTTVTIVGCLGHLSFLPSHDISELAPALAEEV